MRVHTPKEVIAIPTLPHIPLRQTITRLVEWGAGAVYLMTVLFVLALAGLLANQLIHQLLRAHTTQALIGLLDPLLILMMLAELLHTIALVIRTHHLPLKPLLALVFMAVLRHGVVLASTAPLASWDAAATLIGLIVLSLILVNLPAQQDAD